MINTAERFPQIAIAITATDRIQAYKFAQQQLTEERSQQVYRNTLAVLVMRRYLQLLGIDSDLELSHSWNPLERLIENIADLYIPSLEGFLECRCLRQRDRKCHIPQEVWTERIGYAIVQLDEPYQEGHILGFVESISVTELPRSYFQSLDLLLERLTLEPAAEPIVKLTQWLQHKFESDWQPAPTLLSNFRSMKTLIEQPQQQLQNRGNDVIRQRVEQLYRGSYCDLYLTPQEALVKLIQTTEDDEIRWQAAELLWEIEPKHPSCPVINAKDLGIYLLGYSIVLMVGILPKLDSKMLILLRVYPLEKSSHLPSGLKLMGLDENGRPFFSIESRQKDDYIQFKFTADAGDRFRALVVLNDASFSEDFII
ncbi:MULTISPECIES: DUF1822 family protein [Calothrix]|uniref:DUF1822 family protein n=2 Tax=Calothrix TaxID=1186 RepID=A0ABR8A7U8_9CYAN|nr:MULTISPECIES: DUF1822 family protein [Calothrix]MBD2196070.1 DUF1822 family protein [Calothrix parietina FACHB-288]MBD2224720.1 DUF1822 family protein [Calothrix anomala FACHB-343]